MYYLLFFRKFVQFRSHLYLSGPQNPLAGHFLADIREKNPGTNSLLIVSHTSYPQHLGPVGERRCRQPTERLSLHRVHFMAFSAMSSLSAPRSNSNCGRPSHLALSSTLAVSPSLSQYDDLSYLNSISKSWRNTCW